MKLIINFISKLGVDSISRLIGFITLPLITRLLGPDGYGQFTYLFVVLSYFGFFIDFGYINYGTNKLCDKNESSEVIGKIISLQLLTSVFSFVLLAAVSYFFLDTEKYFLLMIFSSTFIAQIFAIKYYYLAGNKLYYNSISELAGQLVYAGLIFIVFIKYPSVFTLIILSVIQIFTTSLFLFIPYIRKNSIKIDLGLRKNLQTLKDAYKLGLASKAEAVTFSFIILCLGFFLNEESVGLYNASYKIYIILLTVVQGLSYTLMPMLLRNVKNPEKDNLSRISFIFYVYLTAGILLSLFTFIFSDRIILLMFGEKFSGAVDILKCFSVTILLMPVWMFCGLVVLAYNRYNYLLLISLSSTFFSVLFSLLLINLFGLQGAGFVLPFTALPTIFICMHFVNKISIEENFSLSRIFSFSLALSEMKNILKSK